MNIEDYRYIITIAESGSLTRASEKLFVTQASLSQRVKYIEQNYGIKIFNRGVKGVKLTLEGERFVHYAKNILLNEDALRNEIQDLHNLNTAPLKIGIPSSINNAFFAELIHNVMKRHPYLKFEIVEERSKELQKQLLANHLNIILCYLPLEAQGISYKLIYEDEFVVLPAYGSRLEKKLNEAAKASGNRFIDPVLLDGEGFAVGLPGTRSHRLINQLSEEFDINLIIEHHSRNFATLYNLAVNGVTSVFLNESFFGSKTEGASYFYIKDSVACKLSMVIAWQTGSYLRSVVNDIYNAAWEVAE